MSVLHHKHRSRHFHFIKHETSYHGQQAAVVPPVEVTALAILQVALMVLTVTPFALTTTAAKTLVFLPIAAPQAVFIALAAAKAFKPCPMTPLEVVSMTLLS